MAPPAIPLGAPRAQPRRPAVAFPDSFARADAPPSLLALVAHELRAPLSTMVAHAEVLLEQVGTLDASMVGQRLAAIRQSTIGLMELVENLLCASSIQAGRFALQRRMFCPADLLTEVPALTAPMLQPRGQVLRAASRGQMPVIEADQRRICQALLNLISNASKLSPPGQPIALTLGAGPERVRFTVADRGPGLPAGSGRRLFASSWHVESTRGPGGVGLGVGLTIVRAIVEAHAGRVGARNRRGGGAAVWFELPTAAGGGLTAGWRGRG